MNTEINSDIGATMCIQEDENFQLLDESENPSLEYSVPLLSNDNSQKTLPTDEVDNIL